MNALRLACLAAVLVSTTVFAAAQDEPAKQSPSPGSEAALRRSIEEVRSGNPDYTQMTPEFGAVVRQQLPQMQSIFKTWGALKSVTFKGTGPMGGDIYDVTFENGAAEFRIALAPDGKIAGEGVRPAGAPPPPQMVGLPLEGAPKAEPGSYSVVAEPAFGAAGLKTFRPASLDRLPKRDRLPVVVWGNGGCSIDSPVYADFLTTIASHGILVLTTAGASQGAPPRQATADDLKAAIDWAEQENTRADSALKGRIETKRVAVMGQSCGGGLAITLGADPRVATIGVFNFGVQSLPAGARLPPGLPGTEALTKLHTPVLLVNGHEPDFMMAPSRATYDAIQTVPAFYGARHKAGHLGTMGHPGGGEFANVAWSWALWQLKGDKQAGAMFVGAKCGLCTNGDWDVEAKRLGK
jgi:dienelactone hydrolase